MPPPILHVIYAGYGDALLLECDDAAGNRQFILVDGGPLKTCYAQWAAVAPYHRYLRAAMDELQGHQGGVTKAIITHPDEDHFGGYMELLRPANVGVPAGLELFIPADNANDTAARDVTDFLAQQGLQGGVNRGRGYILQTQQMINDNDKVELFHHVKAIHPIRNEIWYCYDVTGNLNGNLTHGVDGLGGASLFNRNRRSILMYTMTPNNNPGLPNNNPGIFFTGDNHADIILNRMEAEFNGAGNIPNFAIYKVQHHGSHLDNQLTMNTFQENDAVGREAVIWFLCRVRQGDDVNIPDLQFEMAETAALYLGRYVTQTLQMNWTAWYQAMKARIRYIQDQLDRLTPRARGVAVGAALTVSADTTINPALAFQACNNEFGPNNNDYWSRRGWNLIVSDRFRELKEYVAMRGVHAFYHAFQADSYVVSADGSHGHPRSITLMGLALALRDQGRSAPLYVTSGISINVPTLKEVVSMANSGLDLNQLFCGNRLRIRFLRIGTYISLDGDTTAAVANRDIHAVTQEFAPGVFADVRRVDLDTKLRLQPDQKLLRRVSCQLSFLADPAMNNSRKYLGVRENGNNGLTWYIESNWKAFFWVALKDLRANNQGGYELRSGIGEYSPRTGTIQLARVPFGATFRWTVQGQNQSAYYTTAPNGTRTYLVGPNPPLGHTLIEFEMETRLDPLPDPNVVLNMAFRMSAQALRSSRVASASLPRRTAVPVAAEATAADLVSSPSMLVSTTSQSVPAAVGAATPTSQPSLPLLDALEKVGESLERDKPLQLIDMLNLLFQDRPTLKNILDNLPDMMLQAGFAALVVDPGESTAIVAEKPFMGGIITSASLSCRPDQQQSDIKWPVKIAVASLAIRLDSLDAVVENCQTSDARMTVRGTASIGKESRTLTLTLTWSSGALDGSAVPTVSFSAGTSSIEDLIELMSGSEYKSGIMQSDVPFASQSSGGGGKPVLQDPDTVKTEVGFSLEQPTASCGQYHLAEVWLQTKLSEWVKFLPNPEKFKDVESTARVRIFDPFEAKYRRVGVCISVDLPVGGDRKVSVEFQAHPLSGAGDYDYRLRIFQMSDGTTIPEMAEAVGFKGDMADKVFDAVPGMRKVLDTVRLKDVGLSVIKEKTAGWRFAEWWLELYVPYLEIMPDVVALHGASFRIDCPSDDLMVLRGQAGFRNSKFHKDLVVSFKLPNRLGLGYLRFDAPNGLSISDICDIFSLGDVSGIPVVNELATIEILSFEVRFARPKSGIKFVSLTIKLRKSQLQLGQAIKLEDINLSFTWRKIKDAKPADGDVSGDVSGGKDQIDTSKHGQESSKQRDESLAESTRSVMDFDMSVHLPSIESELSVRYDGQKQALNGVFQSQFQSPLSIAKLLQSGIPGGNSLNMGDPSSTKGSGSLMDNFFDPDSAKAITDLLAGIGLRSFKVSYDSTRNEVSTFAMQGMMMLGSIDLSLSFTSTSQKIKMQGNKTQVQSTWDFSASLPLDRTTDTKTGPKKMKLGALLSGLLGDATGQILPPFITNIEFSQPKNDQELAMKLQKVAVETTPGAKDHQPSQPPGQEATKYFVFDLTLNVSSFSFNFLQCKRASPAQVNNDKTQSATPAAFAKRVMMASLQEIPDVVIPCIGPIKKPVEQIMYLWVQDTTPLDEKGPKGGAAAKNKDGNSDPKMRGLTYGELKAINKVLATRLKPEGDGSKPELLFKRTKDEISDDDVVLEAGHHFMMTGKNAKGEEVVFIDYVFGNKAPSPSSQPGDKKDDPPQQPSGSENSEPAAAGPALAPYKKSSGPISISNIGFEWKGSPKDGTLSIILDVSLLIGPIGFSLIGFKLSFPITDQTSLHNLPTPQVSIDGLAASFNKPPLLISGAFLHQVVDGNHQYMGAVLISYGVYLFQAAGFYGQATAPSGEIFTSAFIFCRFNGPLMSVGWAELSGLVAGVGYNSSIEFPSASQVPRFPLLTPPETSGDPKDSLGAFMGDKGGRMITPRLDSFWVAAGVKVTAFQVLKVDAVLVLSFDPTLKIGIFAMAVADLPPSPSKPGPGAFVHVELALAATIDVALGVLKIEGQLTPASYILDRNCHLTGGFAMYSWFDSPDPNLAGDWVFTIGGYHRSFRPPAHYPVPPRLGISWSFSSSISIRGEAYFAITPKMCMGGGRLDLTLRAGPLRAWFNAYADFLIQYHPFHFIAEAGVSIGVECTIDFCIASVTLRGSLEASLYLEGPPVSGRVSVDFWVATFTIRFGEPPKREDPAGLEDFFRLALQGGDSAGGAVAGKKDDDKAEPHVFSCQAGLVPSGNAETPKEAAWIVRGEGFAFHIACKFVIASCRVITAKAKDEEPTPLNSVSRDWGGGSNNEAQTIYSKPMQKKDPLMSVLDVRIYRDAEAALNTALVAGSDSSPNVQQTQKGGWCKVQRVVRPMPSALWGKYDETTDPLSPSANQDALLAPGNGTKQLMTGLDIQAPDAELSPESPIQFNVTDAMGEAVFAPTYPKAPRFPRQKPAAGSWRPDEPSPDWKSDRDVIMKGWEGRQDTVEEVLGLWKGLSAFTMWDVSKLSGAAPVKVLERFEELYLAMPRLTVVV